MIVVNESGLSKRRLNKLARFVGERCRFPHLTHVHVLPRHASYIAKGMYHDPNQNPDLCATPSQIKLWIDGDNSLFPVNTLYRPSVGAVELHNWEEEFVFALAHEARHNDQQYNTGERVRHYEVDAERFALGVLQDWRNSAKSKEPN